MQYIIRIAELKGEFEDTKFDSFRQPVMLQLISTSALIAIAERLEHIAELMEKAEEKKG